MVQAKVVASDFIILRVPPYAEHLRAENINGRGWCPLCLAYVAASDMHAVLGQPGYMHVHQIAGDNGVYKVAAPILKASPWNKESESIKAQLPELRLTSEDGLLPPPMRDAPATIVLHVPTPDGTYSRMKMEARDVNFRMSAPVMSYPDPETPSGTRYVRAKDTYMNLTAVVSKVEDISGK